MSLMSRVSKGLVDEALMDLFYGEAGSGKTTMAASAPHPIIIDLDRGSGKLKVDRTRPATLEEYASDLRDIENDRHPYETLSVDTIGRFEAMIIDHCCRRDHGTYRSGSKKPLELMIDDVPNPDGYPFGSGPQVFFQEAVKYHLQLERIRRKGINVIMIAHRGEFKKKRLDMDDYKVIGPKLTALFRDFLVEACDDVGYVDSEYEVIQRPDSKDFTKRMKVVTTGVSVLHMQNNGAHIAKNRWRMPPTIPLSWDEYYSRVQQFRTSQSVIKDEVLADIETKLGQLADDPKTCAAAREATKSAGDDMLRLVSISNKLSAKISAIAVAVESTATVQPVAASSQAQ